MNVLLAVIGFAALGALLVAVVAWQRREGRVLGARLLDAALDLGVQVTSSKPATLGRFVSPPDALPFPTPEELGWTGTAFVGVRDGESFTFQARTTADNGPPLLFVAQCVDTRVAPVARRSPIIAIVPKSDVGRTPSFATGDAMLDSRFALFVADTTPGASGQTPLRLSPDFVAALLGLPSDVSVTWDGAFTVVTFPVRRKTPMSTDRLRSAPAVLVALRRHLPSLLALRGERQAQR